jgi:hypothetical protein
LAGYNAALAMSRFVRLLFVLYCVEVGTFLVLYPWGAGWDRLAMLLPWLAVRQGAMHVGTRSLVSAFGAVHLVWGAHDLDLLLAQLRRRRQA